MAIEASRRRAEQADIQISQFELREIIVGSALVSVGAESNSGLCICVITEHKRRAYNDLSQFKLGYLEQADIQISQFELREIIVGSALVLSDDTDTETTITLSVSVSSLSTSAEPTMISLSSNWDIWMSACSARRRVPI
jgi:hypothetical protein